VDPLANLGIDLLEVHVGDSIREALDDLDVVAVAVRDVSGVQAQVDQFAIGVGEKPLDPLLGVDVGVCVRVENEAGSCGRKPCGPSSV
jgi:hypothetical protein